MTERDDSLVQTGEYRHDVFLTGQRRVERANVRGAGGGGDAARAPPAFAAEAEQSGTDP